MPGASFDALFHDGVRLMRAGDDAAATAAFRGALALAPWMVAAHVNLGLLLARTGDPQDAERQYRTALDLDPEHFHARVHLGVLLAAQKRFAAAERCYRAALAVDPDAPVALSNLGVLLACVGREDEAEACYRAAMARDPAYRNAPFNLAYLLLRQGRFEEGWDAFEARDWYGGLARHFQFSRWQGQPLAGKSLMIGFEGGHGDMLQFCRYAAVARAQGASRIAIVCHPALKRLFTRLAGVDHAYGYDEDVPATGWDFWTPPLSFPWALGTRSDTIPADLPYLHADPAQVAAIAPIVAAAGPGLRVGLAWQGNPHFENDADRSLASIDVLAPVLATDGARFFSLQKGPGQLDGVRPRITDLAPHIADFDDTAAFIMALDLVITVDSAVAHLAGALGKPCWVLLPAYKTDWRWLTGRTDSPWYPGVMRLFRQTVAGDWTGVVRELQAALRGAVAART
jgi:Flp pilus assembly protein TadD